MRLREDSGINVPQHVREILWSANFTWGAIISWKFSRQFRWNTIKRWRCRGVASLYGLWTTRRWVGFSHRCRLLFFEKDPEIVNLWSSMPEITLTNTTKKTIVNQVMIKDFGPKHVQTWSSYVQLPCRQGAVTDPRSAVVKMYSASERSDVASRWHRQGFPQEKNKWYRKKHGDSFKPEWGLRT